MRRCLRYKLEALFCVGMTLLNASIFSLGATTKEIESKLADSTTFANSNSDLKALWVYETPNAKGLDSKHPGACAPYASLMALMTALNPERDQITLEAKQVDIWVDQFVGILRDLVPIMRLIISESFTMGVDFVRQCDLPAGHFSEDNKYYDLCSPKSFH